MSLSSSTASSETVYNHHHENKHSHLSNGNCAVVTSLNNCENYEIYIQNIISQLESDDVLMKYSISKEDASIAIEQARGMMELHGKKWLSFIDSQLLSFDVTDFQRQEFIDNISKFNLEKILITVLMEIRGMVKMSEIRERNNLLNISTQEVCFLVFYTFKFALERNVDESFLEFIHNICELGIDGVKFNEFLVNGTLHLDPSLTFSEEQQHSNNDKATTDTTDTTASIPTSPPSRPSHQHQYDGENASMLVGDETITVSDHPKDGHDDESTFHVGEDFPMMHHPFDDEHLLNALRALLMSMHPPPHPPQERSGDFNRITTSLSSVVEDQLLQHQQPPPPMMCLMSSSRMKNTVKTSSTLSNATTTITSTITSTITNTTPRPTLSHHQQQILPQQPQQESPTSLISSSSSSSSIMNHPNHNKGREESSSHTTTTLLDPIMEVVEKILGPSQQQQEELYKEYLRKAYSLFGWMEKLSPDETESMLPILDSYVCSMPTQLTISNNNHSPIESSFVSSSSSIARLMLESRKDFLQLRNKVLKRWQSNMNYFKLRGKEREAQRCKKLMDNEKFINFETCNHYFPQRFKFHRFFTSMTRKAQHNALKMKILVTKISENDTNDVTFRRISSIFYSNKFGHYHLSLVIGSTKIEWCDGSLVVATPMNNLLSDKIIFQYTCYKTSDAKEINRIIDTVSEMATKWNREKTYSMFFCSCQHFIVELLKACGINYQQESSIQEQLKRLRLYDRRIIFRRSFDAIPKTLVDQYFRDYLNQLFQSSKTDLSYDSVPLGSKDSIGESLQRIAHFFTCSTKTTIEQFNRLELDCLYYILTRSGKKSNSDHKLLEAFDRTFLIANKTEYIYVSSLFKKHFENNMTHSQLPIDDRCAKQILQHSRIEQKYFELIYEYMNQSKYDKTCREEFSFICQQMKRFWLVTKISSSAYQMSYQETQTSVENLQWNCPELSALTNLKECVYKIQF
ncbi:hypothetical protein FDP41_013120 [Naegleria fowleri]|uniref:Uncharacterized protein n=1 Tax=Naegleria fowleri TaxID=5763 RepID=A0A6A5BTW0_NAEFO|nr:uncharacterized protein FDP41_013120 [Naegleria fowleri]KAF0980637.1 hypothetical protein FDP41_013120 [Naegleria fowleri]